MQTNTPCPSSSFPLTDRTPLHNHSSLTPPLKRPQSTSSLPRSQCSRHHEKQSQPSKQLKYTPDIRQLPFPLYPSQWEHLLQSKRQQWQTLTKNNRERDRERMEEKVWKEQQQMKDCTFQPNPHKDTHQQLQQTQPGIFNRLFGQAQQRQTNQRQTQSHQQQQQLSLSKATATRPSSYHSLLNCQTLDLSPLYTRLQQVVQEQMQHRKALAAANAHTCPFQPIINKKSEQIISSKKDRIGNIVDRLIQEHRGREGRVEGLRAKYSQQLQKSLTFKPEISSFMPVHQVNKRSDTHDETNDSHTPPHNQDEFSYHPEINPLSALMTKDRQQQTEDEQLFRLHTAATIKRSEKLIVIEAELYSECSFNPEINNLSKELVRPAQGTVTRTTKQHLCSTPQKVVSTHRPVINERSQTMTASKRSRSLENIKMKRRNQAESILKETEYNQLKECTFRPRIIQTDESRSVAKMTSLEDVSGFGNYRRKVEMGQRKEKSRKVLEEKLFNLEKSYDRRMMMKGCKGKGKDQLDKQDAEPGQGYYHRDGFQCRGVCWQILNYN